MKRMKTSFIYSGGKYFWRKMGMHMIGRESNSSHLPDSQVYLYYFLHLWPFNRTPPIWWCCWRFFAHHKLDIKNISSIKGMTSQEAEGWWSPIGDFRHLRYQFFPFFNFPYWYKTATFCLEFFQRYSQFSKSHCLLALKYQIFFRLLHQRSGHPTYTTHPTYSSHPIYPSQASSPSCPCYFSHPSDPSHSCHSSVPDHLSCSSHLCHPSQKYGKIYGVIRAQNITFFVLTESWGK